MTSCVITLKKQNLNPAAWVAFASLSGQECGQDQEVTGHWRGKIVRIDKAELETESVTPEYSEDEAIPWEEKTSHQLSESEGG